MARITRKELKSDKFALEVEHTVTLFEEHRKEIVRYGAIAIAVVALVIGLGVYQRRQGALRQEALAKAIQVQETQVGPPQPGAKLSFATQEAKDAAASAIFSELQKKYPGSAEGQIAIYYLGAIQADQGKLAEAEKSFQEVAQQGDDKYGSLAKLSLAQVYFAEGRADQGEKTLRELIGHPTVFVSADQASLALARNLIPLKPAEARKILDGLRNKTGAAGQVAISLFNELPLQ